MYISRKTAIRAIILNVWLVLFILAIGLLLTMRRMHHYDKLFIQAGKQYEVDPRLISAVVWKESLYRADAVGKAGEIGLMQIMESAAQEWADSEKLQNFELSSLYNPVTNVMAGTWYLAKAQKDWSEKKDPLPYALAQYNAGRSRVLKWNRFKALNAYEFWLQIPFPTTKNYVRDILERYRGGF